ncbi:MAG TPA: PspC domain-containing protein, partial [Ilumatobacteraceae bacterium]
MIPSSVSFARRHDRRVLAGVAGGFADQHGVDVAVVRAALVVLAAAGGVGFVVYALLHFVSSAPGAAMPAAHGLDQRRNAGVAAVTLGVMLIVRASGLWLGDAVMGPLTIVA